MLLLVTGAVCVLVYKRQIRENLHRPLEYTMMTEHKEEGEIVLSREMPEISEVFTCKTPELKKISIECVGKVRRRYAFYGSCGRRNRRSLF